MPEAAIIETPNAPLVAESLPIPETPNATEIKIGTGTIDAAAELGLSTINVVGPEKLLGEDAEETADALAAATGGERRERGKDGKFLPKKEDGAVAVAKSTVKPVTKPAVAAKAVVAAVPPATPAKVKIGEIEKTPEEWASHFKELEAKAKPPEVAKVEPKAPEPKPEEVAAKQKEAEDRFWAEATDRYKIPPEDLDKILTGGPEAATAFSRTLANVERHTRQWAAQHLNQAHAKIAELRELIGPALANQRNLDNFEAERGFLAAHADIASHPQGAAKFREINSAHHDYYDQVQQKIAGKTATPTEAAWATLFESLTPEQFHEDMAAKTRQALAALPAPTVEGVAAPVVETVKPKPAARQTPVASDRPGGATSTPAPSAEARLAQQVFGHHD